MNDSVTFLIALGLVFLVLRWLLGQGGNEQARGPGARVQRRTHLVRQEHLETIQAMFPDIPEGAIRADLARTGSPTITSDNILRNGGTLPLPPATRAEQRAEALGADGVRMDASGSGSRGVMAMSSGVMLNAAHSPLVNRLRVTKDSNSELLPSQPPKVWEADPAKRADILCKRKEFMLLEARKQYMEKQAKASSAAPDHRAETTESCEVIDEKPATNLDNT